jgi:hypothetical protein
MGLQLLGLLLTYLHMLHGTLLPLYSLRPNTTAKQGQGEQSLELGLLRVAFSISWRMVLPTTTLQKNKNAYAVQHQRFGYERLVGFMLLPMLRIGPGREGVAATKFKTNNAVSITTGAITQN